MQQYGLAKGMVLMMTTIAFALLWWVRLLEGKREKRKGKRGEVRRKRRQGTTQKREVVAYVTD
jgi:hypothetical protein